MISPTPFFKIAISVIVPLLLLTACDSKKTEPAPAPKHVEIVAKPKTEIDFTATPPTAESMQGLGAKAAKGDLTAIDTLSRAREFLYKDVDLKDRKRLVSNLKLMNAAFSEIGNAVARPDENDPAFKSLAYAIKTPSLRGSASNALGVAAGKGHKPSLYILLHASGYGMSQSTVIAGLSTAASAGNEEAINYLINLMSDPKARALWLLASKGITPAAEKGNERAKEALAQFEQYQKEKM